MAQTKMQEIGSVINIFREKRDMSLQALSKDSGVSIGFLSELESGKRTNLSIGILAKIATAMSTRASVMLRRLEEGRKA